MDSQEPRPASESQEPIDAVDPVDALESEKPLIGPEDDPDSYGPVEDEQLVADAEAAAGHEAPEEGPHPLRRAIRVTLISVMVTLGLTVFSAVFFHEAWFRSIYLNKICSADEAEQGRGLGFLQAQVVGLEPDNPKSEHDPERVAALAYVRGMLRTADPACFDRVVAALNEMGVWGRNFDGAAWIRYLTSRVDRGTSDQRAETAVELAHMMWHRWDGYDDPRIEQTVRKLMGDADAKVRLNALSAAMCMEGRVRLEIVAAAIKDPEPQIAKHAWIAVGLLAPKPETLKISWPERSAVDPAVRPALAFARARLDPSVEAPAPPSGPPADAHANLKELARLEGLPTASADLPVGEKLPPLLLIEVVRVSSRSTPDDLMPVFDKQAPPLHVLAALVAIERFDKAQVEALAVKLINSYEDTHRTAGAMLGGMILSPDERVIERLTWRGKQRKNQEGWWVVTRHYKLALTMQGKDVTILRNDGGAEPVEESFVPRLLMNNRAMPRTSTAVGLLHQGDLEGVDYFVNALGEPPVPLGPLLVGFRYNRVLKRYLPQMPPVWNWADPDSLAFQIEVLRDWYILHRRELKFDPDKRVYRTPAS